MKKKKIPCLNCGGKVKMYPGGGTVPTVRDSLTAYNSWKNFYDNRQPQAHGDTMGYNPLSPQDKKKYAVNGVEPYKMFYQTNGGSMTQHPVFMKPKAIPMKSKFEDGGVNMNGVIGGVTSPITNTVNSMFPNSPVISGAMGGVKLGAQLGSAIPGVGTAIGAGAGLLLGTGYGLLKNAQENKSVMRSNTMLGNEQEMQRMHASGNVYGQPSGMPVAREGMEVDPNGGQFTGANDLSHEQGGLNIINTATGETVGQLEGRERIFSREDTMLMDHLASTGDYTNLGIVVATAISKQNQNGPQPMAVDGNPPGAYGDEFDIGQIPDWWQNNSMTPRMPDFMSRVNGNGKMPITTYRGASLDTPLKQNGINPGAPSLPQDPNETVPRDPYTGQQIFANVANAAILASNLFKKYESAPKPSLLTFSPYHYDSSSLLSGMLGDISTSANTARYNAPVASAGDQLYRELGIQANTNDATIKAHQQVNAIDQDVQMKNTEGINRTRDVNVGLLNQYNLNDYNARMRFAQDKAGAVSQNIQSIIDTNANFQDARTQDRNQLINMMAQKELEDMYSINRSYKSDLEAGKTSDDFTTYYYNNKKPFSWSDMEKYNPYLSNMFKKRYSKSIFGF